MWKTDFVTYEQAKDLKILGFRKKCLYHYNKDGILFSNSSSNGEGSGIYVEDLECSYNKKDNEYIDAPTIYHTQKWLAKEKKYYINPDPDFSDSWFVDIVNLKNSDLIHLWNVEGLPKVYYSYEDALAAGITETIKLLNNN